MKSIFQRELDSLKFKFSLKSYFLTITSQDIHPSKSKTNNPSPPFVCKFSPNDDVCVCNEDGMIEIISSSRYRFSGHDNAIFDCTWNYDGTMIGTASADCKSRLWDLVTSTLVYELKGHEACVKSISFDNDNPNILVTSSRDNSISIWDKRFENKKNSNGTTISLPIKKIADSHGYKKKSGSVVTAAAFLDHRPFKIVSVGSSDGIIKLWDYRASLKKCAAFVKPQSNINSNGFSSLALSNNGSTIYTSCLNNSIISIDSNKFECMDVYKHKDFNCSSFYIKMDVSFCGDYIACGSRNGNIYLWEAFKKTDPLLLVGHRQEVTAVAWSKRDYKIASCSDDMTTRLWYIPDQKVDKSGNPLYGYAELSENNCIDTPLSTDVDNSSINVDTSENTLLNSGSSNESSARVLGHTYSADSTVSNIGSSETTLSRSPHCLQNTNKENIRQCQIIPSKRKRQSAKRSTSITDYFKPKLK